MTAHTVRTNDVCHLHLLVQHLFFGVRCIVIGTPLLCLIRNTKAFKNVVVEGMLPNEQLMHTL